jgi:hypothetical protein
MCVARVYQATTGPDGLYALQLPAQYLNLCSEVTLHAWAVGYQSVEERLSVAELRAQPRRDIGLQPIGPTPTNTGTEVQRPPRALLPIVLRVYGSASPTSTATPTVTPTATATYAVTGTVTPSPTPTRRQLIVNPSFETDEAWEILHTAYWAGYSTVRAHSGSRCMRLGIESGTELYAYSSVQQTVSIPSLAVEAQLSFYYYPLSTPGDDDAIYFCVLPADGSWPAECWFWTEYTPAWHQAEFDLLPYAGQTVALRFGVRNDGGNGLTAVYLDDVQLWVN